MNIATMVGYLTVNPTNHVAPNGIFVTEFRIMVKKEHPTPTRRYDYFLCVAFGKTAEYIYKYCVCHSKIVANGSVEIDDYIGKDGKHHYSPKFYVKRIEICSTTVNRGDFEDKYGDRDDEDNEIQFL